MKSLNKHRIFLIGPTESILTKRGNRFPNIAQYLVDEGEEVIYYTSDFYHAEKRFFKAQEIQEAKAKLKYKLHVLKTIGYYSNISPRRVINNFLFSFMMFWKLLFATRKNDKILLPSRPVELIFFVAIVRRFKKVKIVLDIQDVWPDALEIENKKKKKIFETYCNIYLKPSLKYYDTTICTAPSFRKWLHRYAPKVSSVFIPLGWENERWKDFEKKSLKKTNTAHIRLVCVAQLQHQIDVMPILEVLKDHKEYHLTIIGEDGKGERYQDVIQYIEKNRIDNIEIIGKVNREDVGVLLENMDVGILPMITPSIPNKIFDYTAAELPIIVLGQNDSSDFVIEHDIGWFCEYNSRSLYHILKELDTASLDKKTKQVKLVKERYSREELHKQIKDILI